MPLERFIDTAKEYISECEWAGSVDMDSDYFSKVCELMQTRAKTFVSVGSWKYFFSDDLEYDEKSVRKMLKKDKESKLSFRILF